MKWLSHRLARLLGWKFHGEIPPDPKLVVIGAPHTSNWDFFIFLAAVHHFDLKAKFLGKHTLFRGPFGWFFRALGGIPVDRQKPGGVVGQVKEAFDQAREMVLVLAPEGTRSAAPRWKSGFVEIAGAAGVRIVPAGIHFPARTVTLGAPLSATSPSDLMDRLREFYADKVGRRPHLTGPVELRDRRSRS